MNNCQVYWGSHGCKLEYKHKGRHVCDCCECLNHPDPDSGCVGKHPYYGWLTTFYGEDAPLFKGKILPKVKRLFDFKLYRKFRLWNNLRKGRKEVNNEL